MVCEWHKWSVDEVNDNKEIVLAVIMLTIKRKVNSGHVGGVAVAKGVKKIVRMNNKNIMINDNNNIMLHDNNNIMMNDTNNSGNNNEIYKEYMYIKSNVRDTKK